MSVLTSIKESSGRMLGRPFAYVSAEWDRLAPRERRSVAALVIAVVVVAVLLSVYFVFSSISDLEDGNAKVREALSEITKNRDVYMEAKSRSQAQEARIGNDPPQLTSDLRRYVPTLLFRAENDRLVASLAWTRSNCSRVTTAGTAPTSIHSRSGRILTLNPIPVKSVFIRPPRWSPFIVMTMSHE